jgi:hypothetical protein
MWAEMILKEVLSVRKAGCQSLTPQLLNEFRGCARKVVDRISFIFLSLKRNT